MVLKIKEGEKQFRSLMKMRNEAIELYCNKYKKTIPLSYQLEIIATSDTNSCRFYQRTSQTSHHILREYEGIYEITHQTHHTPANAL